jgi:hypothetical protein
MRAALPGLIALGLLVAHPASADKVPEGVLLVKGAWSSASDSSTPVPESGQVSGSTYRSDYFGFSYTLSKPWTQSYAGPPPSDSGYYVLAQFESNPDTQGVRPGHLLIAAQDMLFALTPTRSASELIDYSAAHLSGLYQAERAPTPVRIANRSFVRFDYGADVAGLHWYLLATDIRCHALQFIFTGRDARLLERLVHDLDSMTDTSGGDAPVCIRDFATPENILSRVDPVFEMPRFNAVPVRIIIDREGRVRHVHFLSAFPEQASAICEALSHWRFRPYQLNGQPVEVETGIMFGRKPRHLTPAALRQ